ncbi:MAG: segregation/condensation protein A [Opitutales bacterium]|nr:segregation/condensation protein A [Opitutales bacterium]
MAESRESLIQTFDHSVQLPVFEGPLDLLLFLIRKNEIDIYDIPIQQITRQYLSILRNMEAMKIEIAGEFFVMAASLMFIKSRMLLPKDDQLKQPDDEEDEDGVDPRWELVQQLLEYKKFKEAAKQLEGLSFDASNLLAREWNNRDEPPAERPLRPVDRIELWNVFNRVLRRLSEKIVIGQIHDETVTVSECMENILIRLKTSTEFRFTDLFADEDSLNPSLIVATFLALLELTRLKQIELEQTDNFSDILCRKKDPESDVELEDLEGELETWEEN